MNARTRRLVADNERIKSEFTNHPYIKVVPTEGNPPSRYQVTFHLHGLRWDKRLQRPVETDFFQAEIYLHRDYPRIKPRCVMMTDIFHPNFGSWICIGDYWAAGETLADVIIQIGQLIQYQKYNAASPVNTLAARWARENEHLLPIGTISLYRPQSPAEIEADISSVRQHSPSISIDLGDDSEEPAPAINDDLDIKLL